MMTRCGSPLAGQRPARSIPEPAPRCSRWQHPALYDVTLGAGAVWVPSPGGVSRLDPVTGAITHTIPVELEVTDLAASDDAVWVTHKNEGMVSRIDPAMYVVVVTFETGAGAHDLAIDEHGVWITNYQANTVSRSTLLRTPSSPRSKAWVRASGSPSGTVASSPAGGTVKISRIDPATNEAHPAVHVGGWPYGLAYGNGEAAGDERQCRRRPPPRRRPSRTRRGDDDDQRRRRPAVRTSPIRIRSRIAIRRASGDHARGVHDVTSSFGFRSGGVSRGPCRRCRSVAAGVG